MTPTSTCRLLRRSDQLLAVIWHSHSQDENTKNVEYSNPPEGLLNCPRDVLSWIRGFTECHTHDLSTRESETRLANTGPEPKEATCCALRQVLRKSARLIPIFESGSFVVGAAAHGADESGENQGCHDQDFCEAKPELGFAETVDMHHLYKSQIICARTN